MIIGYQVKNSKGQYWNNSPSNELFTEIEAVQLLQESQCDASTKEHPFDIIAVVKGSISNPIWNWKKVETLNTESELTSFSEEFSGEIEASFHEGNASDLTVCAAKRLHQDSCWNSSIVIPNETPSVCAGDGSGEWLVAMIFVPHDEIFSDFNKQKLANNN